MFDLNVVVRAGQTGARRRLQGPSQRIVKTSHQLFEIHLYHVRPLFC